MLLKILNALSTLGRFFWQNKTGFLIIVDGTTRSRIKVLTAESVDENPEV